MKVDRPVALAELPLPLQLGLQFNAATSHADRYRIIRELLDHSFLHLTDSRKEFAASSEDALTCTVILGLTSVGVSAIHDKQIGGHADLVVEGRDNFRWIGEAKLYSGPSQVHGGYLQLTTRYGVSQPGRDSGDLIIYCKRDNATTKLEGWKGYLFKKTTGVTLVEPLDPERPFEFKTVATCEATGLPFNTRHVIVPMYHNPKK
ncbi:hypothetical protein RYZ20_10900 [Thioclava sp. A2]|uniref:hypothetical protein n=1 Tax=Thioclava sp. FCG-A2 TaxID=3080562 RepID=UPI002954BC4E|nr:hypothetical protein [Thioclava sp. A2]MDV7271408.1 hypothetical protein [Thioclava sp. A2]